MDVKVDASAVTHSKSGTRATVEKLNIKHVCYSMSPHFTLTRKTFPDSSVGKESACNARDPGAISWVRKIPGEGIGNPLQYSWASLVAQLVKNLPVTQETWV